MGLYLLRRSGHAILVIFVVLTFIFVAGRLIGDPAALILGPSATPSDIADMREAMGLSDPLLEQYWRFISGAVRGDFGVTLRHAFSLARDATGVEGAPTLPIVLGRLPATFLLAIVSIGIAVSVSVPMGILAAMKPRSIFDRLVNIISLAGVSVVEFWLGFMLVLFVSVRFGWLPTSGGPGLEYVILPALTIASRPIGRLTQIVRSAMLDELAKPYIATLRAKGMSEPRVVFGHALKNASIPIVTIFGDETTNLLTGVIPVEIVFAWPGMGLLLIDALSRRDLPLIEATIFVLAVMIVFVNLMLDLIYTYIDPKIRFA